MNNAWVRLETETAARLEAYSALKSRLYDTTVRVTLTISRPLIEFNVAAQDVLRRLK